MWGHDVQGRFWSNKKTTLQLKMEGQLAQKKSNTIPDIDNTEL